MANRLSEGLPGFDGIFGLAQTKSEGAEIPFDTQPIATSDEEETYWFERPFTKAQYVKLAALCEHNHEPFIMELFKEFSERAHNGHGGGF